MGRKKTNEPSSCVSLCGAFLALNKSIILCKMGTAKPSSLATRWASRVLSFFLVCMHEDERKEGRRCKVWAFTAGNASWEQSELETPCSKKIHPRQAMVFCWPSYPHSNIFQSHVFLPSNFVPGLKGHLEELLQKRKERCFEARSITRWNRPMTGFK